LRSPNSIPHFRKAPKFANNKLNFKNLGGRAGSAILVGEILENFSKIENSA